MAKLGRWVLRLYKRLRRLERKFWYRKMQLPLFFSSLFPSFPLWHFRLCITAFFRSCGPALNVAVFEFSVVIFIVTFVSPGINSTFQRNLFVANRARELCLSVSTKLASAGEAFRLVRMTPKEDKHKKKNERTPTMAD